MDPETRRVLGQCVEALQLVSAFHFGNFASRHRIWEQLTGGRPETVAVLVGFTHDALEAATSHIAKHPGELPGA